VPIARKFDDALPAARNLLSRWPVRLRERVLGFSSFPFTTSGRNRVMNRFREKLTYPNVISTLCLILLVGGGTAYAATGMPAKNSVGPKQIKKGAVTPVKLSKAAKETLTGPQGAPGPQGPKGDQGGRGPSNAITKSNPGFVPWATTYTTIESLNLGAGSWVMTATGLAVNHEGSVGGANCRLLAGGTTVDATGELFLASFPQPGAKQDFSLTGGAAVAGEATAELQCEATLANGQVVDPSISAIQVGELNVE
jgi:hypothetical protein